MMKVKVVGLEKTIAASKKLFKKLGEENATSSINATLDMVGVIAKKYTPVDTGELINSQFKKIEKENGKKLILGTLGYSAPYAIYLENGIWTPRKKMTAKPHFLQSAFEENAQKQKIISIIRKTHSSTGI